MASMRARAVELEKLYTVAEFEQLPEFDERYELIDGRLVEKSLAGEEHSFIIDIIRDAIKAHDPRRQLGYSLQEVSVTLGPRNSPIPDVSYWKANRNARPTDKAAPLPDLAIEVHSPGDVRSNSALQSAMVKVERLVMAGVSIVWVVNPKEKTVEVYHAGSFVPVKTLSLEDELDGEDVIPGFKLSVRELFE